MSKSWQEIAVIGQLVTSEMIWRSRPGLQELKNDRDAVTSPSRRDGSH